MLWEKVGWATLLGENVYFHFHSRLLTAMRTSPLNAIVFEINLSISNEWWVVGKIARAKMTQTQCYIKKGERGGVCECASLPVQSSSILPNCALKQSFTHNSISCRDKLSDVTFVEYTFTAIVDLFAASFKCFAVSSSKTVPHASSSAFYLLNTWKIAHTHKRRREKKN